METWSHGNKTRISDHETFLMQKLFRRLVDAFSRAPSPITLRLCHWCLPYNLTLALGCDWLPWPGHTLRYICLCLMKAPLAMSKLSLTCMHAYTPAGLLRTRCSCARVPPPPGYRLPPPRLARTPCRAQTPDPRHASRLG